MRISKRTGLSPSDLKQNTSVDTLASAGSDTQSSTAAKSFFMMA
ncbi:hypothetical protein C7S14_1301 [Burkholderia cepacia]|nr:hypothetical protein C7S14_1301 [Burkholderia cepacia]